MGNVDSYKNIDADSQAEEESVSPEDMGDMPEADDVASSADESQGKYNEGESLAQQTVKETEQPITHLKNPINNRVVEATPFLMSRKDLIPCDEHGKKVCDHRVF